MNRPLAPWFLVAAVACGGAPPADSVRGAPTAAAPAPAPTSTPTATDPRLPDPVRRGVRTPTAPPSDPGVPYPMPDWPKGAPEAFGLSTTGLDAAASVAEANQSFCLLVIRHGVLVYERYMNGADATTQSPSWSIAKSYASTLVGIALDRGDLPGLDTSVSEYVPEWKADGRAAITIRNLVSMTSGLKWDPVEDYVGLATLATDDTSYAIARPLANPPGSTWTYDNGTVQILDRVFRVATGSSIEQYAQLHLWSKLGSNATWKHDPSGNPTVYANVLATCRDHARLGYLYLHGGVWAGVQVVSPAWVAAALTPSQTMNRAYCSLWWLNAETPAIDAMGVPWQGRMVSFAPTDLFAARGFGNQFVDVIPSLDMMVVRFGQDPLGTFDIAKLTVDAHFGIHDAILAPLLAAVTP